MGTESSIAGFRSGGVLVWMLTVPLPLPLVVPGQGGSTAESTGARSFTDSGSTKSLLELSNCCFNGL